MAFVYHRTIHFSDTDAAGVVFFPNYLAICHEAYEESLAAAGLDLKTFFSEHAVVVPIAQSRAEYLRPLACGDKVRVALTPARVDDSGFVIDCDLHRLGPPEKLAARVHTEHVCIAARTRERRALPAPLAAWIKQYSA
jgi:1,4-dihydroxy-2-naphthoyl-CoA hydrolase